MSVTTRGLFLFCLGLVPPLLLAGSTAVAAAIILIDVAIICLLATDVRAIPSPSELCAVRHFDPTLSIGRPNRVAVRLSNPTSYHLSVDVADNLPEGLTTVEEPLSATIPPREKVELTYDVVPVKRGDFSFGVLSIGCAGPLGLARRHYQVSLPQEVRVVPDLHAIRRFSLATRRAHLLDAGLRSSRIKGGATEFERLRDYTPDDDFRHICWPATARRGRPVTREFRTERNQQVFLLLDTARLMSFKAGALSKLDYAVNTALLLAYVAATNGDRVGLMAFADEVRLFVPSRQGKAVIPSLINALYSLEPLPTEADLERAAAVLATRCRRRSLVVLFTDVVDETTSAPLLKHMAWLRTRHLPLVVTVNNEDFIRRALPSVDDDDAFYLTAAAGSVLTARFRALTHLRSMGLPVIDSAPGALSRDVVARYFELKATGRI